MAQLSSKNIGVRIRLAREQQQLTQAALAGRIGLSQTAISHLERGQLAAVSEGNLTAVCAALGLPAAEPSQEGTPTTGEVVACCPNPTCPLSLQVATRGRLLARPHCFKSDSPSTRFCHACGSPLSNTCRNASCRAPILEGASCCTFCGDAYAPHEAWGPGADIIEVEQRLNRRAHDYQATQTTSEKLPTPFLTPLPQV